MAKTLLLADDSVTIQKVVSISFASEDVTLVTVDNGDDAIDRAKETRPDLILADVVMPGKSGYEVCEAIKADPELRHIPVLLLSGTFEAFDEERAARAGAAGHVAKPFEAQTLVSQVNQLLAAAPPAAPEPPPAPFAPPEAVTVAAASDAGESEGFDFFDDDLADLAPPGEMESLASSELDDAESAFAFGDDELTGDDDMVSVAAPSAPLGAVAAPSSASRRDRSEPFPDRTVAILPDTPERSGSPAVPPTALADDALDIDLRDPGDDELSASASELEDSFLTGDVSATSDEAFDFSFERESTAPEAIRVESALQDGLAYAEADDDDVVEGTAFDTRAAAELEVEEVALVDDAAPADATHFLADEPMFHEPVANAEFDGPDFDAADEGFSPEPIERQVPITSPPPHRDSDDAPRALSEASAARAEAVLREISPKLGEAVHDTLEKIAWESFGEATEKIVREVVDRVEQIAWEVIPQLTETLIKAEIRRLKGEDED